VRLSKEYAELEPVVKVARELRSALSEKEDLEELVDDAEMGEVAREELATLLPRIEELERELQMRLLPKDAADERNVILEIRAGTGGDEAALFAGDLFRMYQRYAQSRG